MRRTVVSRGVYKDELGGFWIRPWVAGKRTWRKLRSTKTKHAIEEAAGLLSQQARAGLGLARDPIGGIRLGNLADDYLAAGCPNRRLESRPGAFADGERARVSNLKRFFGARDPAAIRLPDCHAYRRWRVAVKQRRGTGDRAAELDLVTLSNVLNYGVSIGQLDVNWVRSGRPRFRKLSDVRHSRDRAPANAEMIHRLASHFFARRQSEVLGWQLLFAAYTGCRVSELLRLRLDATTPDQPGFVAGGFLFIRRSKGGVSPFVAIGPELQAVVDRHRKWCASRFPGSPWYFPGRLPSKHVDTSSLGHGLPRACAAIGCPPVTPHGLRSYYVTKRRSDGVADAQIAAEIGDKTVTLIHQTYGDRPANWSGGDPLTWAPKDTPPAWSVLP